ncbi:MAG: hemerythrin HHE cation-binding protein [Azospirillum brasilense]|nr:MAG: hemerythrin HHE cation-binding protein [Azospirillum brasilense]
MLDFLKPENDAILILKKDHDVVDALFDDFKKAESRDEKCRIALEAINELRMHALVEEEIFYPAMRAQGVDKDMLNEADEEHHVAKLLIAELATMDGSEQHFDAKFTVLAENIRHHVKEEEHDLFPKCRDTEVDMVALGERMLARKDELKTKGIPANAEELLMARQGVHDSSAEAAMRKPRAA